MFSRFPSPCLPRLPDEPTQKRQKLFHPVTESAVIPSDQNDYFHLQVDSVDGSIKNEPLSAESAAISPWSLSTTVENFARISSSNPSVGQSTPVFSDCYTEQAGDNDSISACLNGPKSNGHDLELPSASGESTKQGGLVCFGAVLDLPFVPSPSAPPAPHDLPTTRLAYNPSNALLSEATTEQPVGSVADPETQQFLSTLAQEGGIELQIQLRREKRAKKAYGNKGKGGVSLRLRLNVIVYGPVDLFDDIGDFIQENGHYLQEPSHCDRNVPYRNPHCMSGEDDEVPFTFDLGKQEDDFVPAKVPNLLFGLETCEVLPEDHDPPGLTTSLYSHQKQALTFMKRRENGWSLQNPGSDLWSAEITSTGERNFINNITGDLAHHPLPVFRGGILADDMGLGKTLTIIALVASGYPQSPDVMRWAQEKEAAFRQVPQERVGLFQPLGGDKQLEYAPSTLLVVPSSVLQQWETQLNQHLQRNGPVRWTFHHGSSKIKAREQIKDYAIVATTFPTLVSEYQKAESPLFTTFWRRIVLDEAHCIRNRHTVTARAIFDLEGHSRWAVTGTPIQNRVSDFASLLQFLRVHPYCDRKVFAEDIVNVWRSEDENLALDRLKRLFKYISIRRSKTILDLPKRTDIVRYLQFDDDEWAAYKALENPIVTMIDGELQSDNQRANQYMEALAKISLLRRFCNFGPTLQEFEVSDSCASSPARSQGLYVQDLLDDLFSSGQGLCSNCNSAINAMQIDMAGAIAYWTQCSSLICCACYSPTMNGRDSKIQSNMCVGHIPCDPIPVPPPGGLSYRTSVPFLQMPTKMRSLQEELLRHGDEKSVVFSSWTTTFDMIQSMLDASQISYVRIDGKVSQRNRASALSRFQTEPSIQVMLLSIFCGAEGLNITAASRVYLMEPQWNPNIESQALARVHRLGQTREVTTIMFIMKDSIESHVINVQDRKKHLGDLLLSQSRGGAEVNRARLQHLRSLLN
ncbi:SNF2 family N-terminal domain-containing protein [Aspergillus pseudodeflectus]|uniref:SNF2 family N-terminal domain-containing protein n=1 Tax=Aspergillus pseudodeflectus TaxID=176178 RepID=A0ABR4KJU6_9EURO